MPLIEFRPLYKLLEQDVRIYNWYRNVARFYLREESIIDRNFYDVYLFGLAVSCEMVGDFMGAEKYLNKLNGMEPVGGIDRQRLEEETRGLEIRRTGSRVEVECKDEKLKGILENLAFVFFNLSKNIRAYVVNTEEEYTELARTELGYSEGTEIYPYSGWAACGFYQRPEVHCLVFKEEFLRDEDDAITGLCAHEIAHLELHDLYDPQIRERALRDREADHSDSFLFREWMTDFHVIQKGFAYELFRSRERYCEQVEPRLLSAAEIEYFVQKVCDYAKNMLKYPEIKEEAVSPSGDGCCENPAADVK